MANAASSRRPGRRARAAGAVLGMAGGALLLLSGPASAHVRVLSDDARASSPATLRFRVPSEKADVSTIRVDVTLPPGVTVVTVPAAPGWTHQDVPASSGRPAHLIWTAGAGQEITPDAHRYFGIRTAALPNTPSLTFDVAQTYSDGSVVQWNQRATGGQEPAFPAPVLLLAGASPAASVPVTEPPRVASSPAVTAPRTAAESGSASVPSWPLWAVTGTAVIGAAAVTWRSRSARR